MASFNELTEGLTNFMGGPKLGDINIYHDFIWSDKFERKAFRNGLRLASLVKADCPINSIPSLILMSGSGIAEGIISEPPNYSLVINIDSYLASATPDAAAAYFTLRRSADTRLEITSLLASDATLRDDVIISNLTPSYILRWVAENPLRVDELRTLLDQNGSSFVDGDTSFTDPATVIDLLHNLSVLPENLITTMIATLTRLASTPAEHQSTLIQHILSTTQGRNIAAIELGSRIAERIQDIRDALRTYEALINNTTTTETETHTFIIEHPWLLGSEYIKSNHELPISRGRIDCLLEKYDGHHDLMELKSPNHRIIVSTSEGNIASSPTQFRLSAELSNAIAQVNRYLFILERDNQYLPSEFGIQNAKHPKAYILIGNSADCSPSELETLTQLNKTLHRIEIIPFDTLILKCDAMLAHLERSTGQLEVPHTLPTVLEE